MSDFSLDHGFERFKMFVYYRGVPHVMHGDVVIKGGYPTHTHGLEKVGLPELFINSTAFGPQDNARTINAIVYYLSEHKDDYEKVASGRYTEIVLWGEDYPVMCIRSVPLTFAGVELAYNLTINPWDLSKTGYAQVYVKGDDYVLEDSYYIGQERGNQILSCATCNGEE